MMKISKWGNSLAIRIPADIAHILGFAEGDQVHVDARNGKLVAERALSKQEKFDRVKKLRGLVPAGYKFKRSDAYEDDEI